MNIYKFNLHSGQSFLAEDKRDLQKLCSELCSAGFVIVQRRGSGYSSETMQLSVLERAVASIEPALQ
jgi:hypothetical protein